MNSGKRIKKILQLIAGLFFLGFILTPSRFAPTDLECKRTITIKEKYIVESIIAFAASNRDINLARKNNKSLEYCEISLNTVNEETNPLHLNKDLVEESHTKVMIGGTWMPTNCVPLVKVDLLG